LYAVPEHFLNQRKEHHDTFFCPSGHRAHFGGPTEAERERDKAIRDRDRYKAWLREEEENHQAERKAHSATKGKLTRTRKRIAAGVCPCCHRHFADLQRHMDTKHVGYSTSDV
jgi:hypothetical protein